MPFASLTLLRSVPVATETAVTATPGTLAPVGSTMTPRIAPVLAVWAKTGLFAIHATNIAGKQNFSLRIRGRIRIDFLSYAGAAGDSRLLVVAPWILSATNGEAGDTSRRDVRAATCNMEEALWK